MISDDVKETNSSSPDSCQASRAASRCNLPSPASPHKHPAFPVCLFYLPSLLCECVFFSLSHLCSLIVLWFNRSLFPGLVSFLALSFHPPPPPPRLRGLVFCTCRGSFHVSLAGRNRGLNTQWKEENKQTNSSQRTDAERLSVPPSLRLTV